MGFDSPTRSIPALCTHLQSRMDQRAQGSLRWSGAWAVLFWLPTDYTLATSFRPLHMLHRYKSLPRRYSEMREAQSEGLILCYPVAAPFACFDA